jgi:hypothetical protein
MAESEIPEDIRATAKTVRDKLCIDCECTFDEGCGCLDALHEALLAEREECHRIALERTAQVPGQNDFTRGYTEGRLAAARDIVNRESSYAPTP